MQASLQKARGQAKSAKYPQAEETLGDVFTRGGTGIGDDSPYGMYTTSLILLCLHEEGRVLEMTHLMVCIRLL